MQRKYLSFTAVALLLIAVLVAIYFLRNAGEVAEETIARSADPIPAPTVTAATQEESASPEATPEEQPPAVYTLIARVWTREGHLVPGAELNSCG